MPLKLLICVMQATKTKLMLVCTFTGSGTSWGPMSVNLVKSDDISLLEYSHPKIQHHCWHRTAHVLRHPSKNSSIEQTWRKKPCISCRGMHTVFTCTALRFAIQRDCSKAFCLFFNVCTGVWAREKLAFHRQGRFPTYIHPSHSV